MPKQTSSQEAGRPEAYDPKRSPQDHGSPEVQVTYLTARIKHLTEHLKVHKKDKSSLYGLQKMVSKRRRQLKYLMKVSPERYQSVRHALSLKPIR